MGRGPAPLMTEPFPREGLELEQARRQVLAAVQPLAGSSVLPLSAALGRVNAEPVLAREAVPGFRAAIMDGYGLPDADPPPPGSRWTLVGCAAAGSPYNGPLEAGQAIRIFTGAAVPDAVQRVIPQELVESSRAAGTEAEPIRLHAAASANRWIRAADEEAGAGLDLLPAGIRLGPADLARLAGCGVASLPLHARPRVGLLITGDELVPLGARRQPGQIWESNSTLLMALLQRLGHTVAEVKVLPDDPAALRGALAELSAKADVVVSTGGVSAGDGDWIRPLLAELGEVQFWKLFLRPGRPFAFGRLAGRPFFGLPGNPVAAAITALQLLWPALEKLEGIASPAALPRLRVALAKRLERSSGRPELARARLSTTAAGRPLALVEGSQASSRIGSLQGADLLLEIPADATVLEAGQELWAQLLRLPVF